MIFMLAPGPYLTFTATPSGNIYVSDVNSLLILADTNTVDQLSLQNSGCVTLSPVVGLVGNPSVGALTLAGLYALDTTNNYQKGTIAAVFSDSGTPANNGEWVKTGTGTGSGNWTQVNLLPTSSVINVSQEVSHSSNYNLVPPGDFFKMHVFVNAAPALPLSGALQSALPAAASYVGSLVAFRNSPYSTGAFTLTDSGGTTVVKGWENSHLILFPGEEVTLRAGSAGWEIIDGVQLPVSAVFYRSATLGNLAIPNTLVFQTVTMDTLATPTGGAPFSNSGFIGLSSGRLITPRKGRYLVTQSCRLINDTGPPTQIVMGPIVSTALLSVQAPIGGTTHMKLSIIVDAAGGGSFIDMLVAADGNCHVDTSGTLYPQFGIAELPSFG